MVNPLSNHDTSDAEANADSHLVDPLALSHTHQQILRWITRQREVSLTELAQHFEQAAAAIHPLITQLVEQGFVQTVDVNGELYYRSKLVTRKGRNVPNQIWEKLEE